mgnify:FL=1
MKRTLSGNALYRLHIRKTFDLSKRVYVYRNLHKNCWSVRQAGKVLDHTHFLLLHNCRYLVGESGRQRVISEKKKNVHAGISGYLVNKVIDTDYWEDWGPVSYNPYENDSFMLKDGCSLLPESKRYWYIPMKTSNYCIIDNKKVEAVWTYKWRDYDAD